ncbi:barstar family protein [Streptomyces sp. NPDC003781]|uniref:barstar family protein n=1 Tax=Streptomyces sp. NPDC003781 TaxID=3364686 RepID=UPI0036A34E43
MNRSRQVEEVVTLPWCRRRRETELEVDLRGRSIETLDDFWDAVAEPRGLPEWCGRNTEAWRDTIQARGISDVIDSYDVLVVHVDERRSLRCPES